MKPSVELTSPTLELKKRLGGRGDGRTSYRAYGREASFRAQLVYRKKEKAIPEQSLFFKRVVAKCVK